MPNTFQTRPGTSRTPSLTAGTASQTGFSLKSGTRKGTKSEYPVGSVFLPIRDQSSKLASYSSTHPTFDTTWSSDFRNITIDTGAARSSDPMFTLCNINDTPGFGLGTYTVSFTVDQTSGTSINTPITNSSRNYIQLVVNDSDGTTDTSAYQNRYKIVEGFNSITTEVFQDSSGAIPAIALFFHRSGVFNATISDIKIERFL